MKKTKRILAGILGFAIVLGLLAFYESGNGDPFSEAHAGRQAVSYAEKLYPGQTFTVTQILYDTPFEYRTTVQSQQSRDTYFDVVTHHWTDTSDLFSEDGSSSHEWYVESGLNTRNRMGREAAKQVVFILQRELPDLEFMPIFGIDSDKVAIDLCYGDDLVKYKEYLPLDEDFDPSILQKIPTRFVAHAWWPEIPTEEDLQNTLREIKAALEKYEMPMTYYDILLAPKAAADDESMKENLIQSGVVASDDIN